MKTMKSYLGTVAAVSLLLVSGAVSAAPIQGDVTFTGSWEPRAADTTTKVSIPNAVHIAFLAAEVDAALGDFAGSEGPADYTDFTFDPFTGPIVPLWTIVANGITFSFTLEAVTVGLQTNTLLVLQGTGTVIASGPGSAGFDPTAFFWEFSGNDTGSILSFSAIAANVADVPEPSVVGLLGLGLIAMGAVGVRRRSAARKA
ncbi:MAG: PEP-CTERM sorting domain-containing protein [Cryobacterium sp.]